MLFYLKVLSYAIKEHRVNEFIKLRTNKSLDKFKQKRKQEYFDKQTTIENAIDMMFSNVEMNTALIIPIHKSMDLFVESRKNMSYNTVENPYPIESALSKYARTLLFYLTYFSKPAVVVETGTAYGFSSSYILSAMQLNNKGRLISIDGLFLPWHSKEQIGAAIPEELKNRHKLIIQKDTEGLSQILDSEKSIDIFIHDSSHTYKHMMMEFIMTWSYIKEGGYLLSDDVSENDAFLNFCDMMNKTPIIIPKENNRHFGIVIK
tara:strand:+ start:45 stop:830 length:786 start_codon:yes stop_codon:yes gene_type:complete